VPRISRTDRRLKAALAAVLAVVALGGAGFSRADRTDPPVLVPWSKIGHIALGEPAQRVEREYGTPGHGYHVLVRTGGIVQGYYRLHGSDVYVTFQNGRVNEIDFSTPYYRTASGFGVGSTIPLGPCHRTATTSCEHRWHGFVWNAWNKGSPCSCWVKVGLGAESLPATVKNFLEPWAFVYMHRGHVQRFLFAWKFVD
jgi:hypothetical protein